MEDESASITIKVEVQEEMLEDQSSISEEHNYNKIMEEDLYYRLQVHHSIDIKEESEEIETGNSCFDEITIQQQIEAEKQKDELIQNNVIASQDLDIELGELHETIDIKVEDEFMEVNDMQEESSLITDNPSSVDNQATNGNLKTNTQGESGTTKYLTLEDFGEVKAQKMPISSGGLFLKKFIEIGKQRNIVCQILKYYAHDESMNKH